MGTHFSFKKYGRKIFLPFFFSFSNFTVISKRIIFDLTVKRIKLLNQNQSKYLNASHNIVAGMGNANITYEHKLVDVKDLLLIIDRITDPINSQVSCQSLSSDREHENLENITLIWLDPKISLSQDDHQKTFRMLCEINSFTKICTDPHDCIKYIKTIYKENVFLIISGSLTKVEDVFTQIESSKAVDSIFIFCENCFAYEDLRQSRKVVGIFKEQEPLMKAIKKQLSIVSKQLIAFSFFDKSYKTHRNITKDNSSFLWFQLLFDLLKDMEPDMNAKNKLLEMCEDYYRADDSEKRIFKILGIATN